MKGVLHTVEAVLGVMIILLGVIMVYPIRAKTEVQLSEIGYVCLKELDQEGTLKYYVENDLTFDLNTSLRNCIAQIADFTFEICDTAVCNPNTVPDDKEIFVSNYLVSGYETYEANLVSVWLWLK